MRPIALPVPYLLRAHRRSAHHARIFLALGFLCLAGAMQAGAQTKRCDLVGRDTSITGNPARFKRCLDLSKLNDTTIFVPSNVTRIDNDGLSLCKSAVQTGGDVDLVYVYDNSGSMKSNYAFVNTTTRDTTFYETLARCTDATLLADSVTFSSWNTGGTAVANRTVPKLRSDAGCTELAGDPYNTRGRAFYLGIADQASRAPASSAGIMSFTGTVGNIRQPRVLGSQANIDFIRNGINAVSNGGTNYYPPLDTAKRWLSGSLTANPKKAIIFLSDGKPTDTSYTPLLPGMPPIYGIFLGKPRPDTLALSNMSKRTGGKFYLIPPDDPDSLKSVVAAILNIILLEYSPQGATVKNASMTPAQSATSAPSDFILQPDGSWLMRLSDVIGLRGSNTNAITVATTFKEKNSGALDTKTVTFSISTTLAPTGTTQKLGTTQFGVACYDKSFLAILDAKGVIPAWFTDTNSVYQVRIRTAPSPLDSATAASETGVKSDDEAPRLKSRTATADSLVFQNPFAFLVSPGTAHADGNGTLESNLYDSIIVSWVHPRDAQDVAADTMQVRALGLGATVWFSQTNGGAATSQFLVDAPRAYIVVKDQAADPRRTYTAVVTAEKFGIDREVVTLAESAPGSGILLGSLPIRLLTPKSSGDNELEVSNGGDQLRVVYKDPVDGDSATATAGFDENVQEAPNLEFTDADGAPLAPGAVWSPATGKLYLSYSDDYAYGRVPSKQVFLTLANRKYGAAVGTDHERITLTMKPASGGTRATWTGSIDLADAFPAYDSNGTAETRFRGEAAIVANTHDNVGAQQTATVADFLVIAYPDSQAAITWKMDTTVKANEGMIFAIKDQTFTLDQKDTVLVSVACTKSGDSVSGFTAVEAPSAASGIYTTGTLAKDEGTPSLADRALSCLTTDQIRVRYVDPVYGTLTELLIDEAARPEANPPGRNFILNELVTLASATPGAIIYYTTDGTLPIPGSSPVYTDPIRIGATTTLRAIAVKAGFKNSKVLVQTYTKTFVASRLEILDENGNSIPGGVITGASKAVRIKLVTTQDNASSIEAGVLTKVAGDRESVPLGNAGSLGNAIELWQQVALKHPFPKASGNDTIEATGTDTLIVTWVNPLNPKDVAADTVVIKPAFVAAQVYFSASENGPQINQYPVGQESVYVVVMTHQPRDPSLTYTVTVTSSDGSGDREVLALTVFSPGVFSAKVPVGTAAKAKGDGTIQVAAAGDQLTAVFTDPVYKIDYRGDAGFAQQVQESASLEFIDESGKLVPPGEAWSPAKRKVYLRFSDDWNPGIADSIATQTVRLKLVNRKSGDSVGADAETVVLALKDSTASRGIWEGFLILADKASAKNGNDTLESYYRGDLKATVTPHDNAGHPAGPDVSDDLLIAYPDQSAEIVIRDVSGKSVERKTDKVDILIHDQLFTTSGPATIQASVGCAQSGDNVSRVILEWNGSAYAIKPPLGKGEPAGSTVDKTDALLLCLDSDILTVTYTDPVYLKTRSADVKWSDDPVARMYYEAIKDGSTITSISDASAKDFRMVVVGKSPSRDKIDVIQITLTTKQGERETYFAVETGAFTGKFTVKTDFRFQSSDPKDSNAIVEARINPANRINQVLVEGSAVISGTKVTADLALISSYNLVARAYIKDDDENGRADHAYFVFDHKLSRLPGSLSEVYWNEEGPDFRRKAESAMLSFRGSDSSVVVADFSASQFGANLTDSLPGRPAPFALFPDDNLFGGQKAELSDSVGPVIVTAEKHPSSLLAYNVTLTEKRFYPDTLTIKVSEKLKTSRDFLEMIRFSKGCQDYGESMPLRMFSQPAVEADGLSWLVIVDNALDAKSPDVGDCIFLETDGRYTDLRENRPARLGVPLTGANPNLVIRGFRGFPPVAGLDPSRNSAGFLVSTQEDRSSESSFSKPGGIDNTLKVIWVPPYGFDPRDPVGSLERVAKDFGNPEAGERSPEQTNPQPMPAGISTVQVITTTPYRAQIRIFDNLGHFVRGMTQAYGFNGEMKNGHRTTSKGQASFLVWDMLDKDGNKVGNGVYVWKVAFQFVEKNQKSEIMYTRTGVIRP